MKRLWLFAIVALTSGLFTSCETDPIVDPVDDNFAPSLALLADNPYAESTAVLYYSEDKTLFSNDDGQISFSVGLEGSDATPTLKTLEVFLNDTRVTSDNFEIIYSDGTSIGGNNPALIVAPYDTTFRAEVKLETMLDFGVNTFRFVLTDQGDLTSETSIVITIEEEIIVDPGTDITGDLTGVLLNQAGPPGTGGLDLDNGMSVGSASADAEIKDDGIDNGPVATNWLQTISSVNGTTIRTVNTTNLPEGYDFANVATKEEIIAAWDNGDALSGASTDVVAVGDEFIVSKADGSVYYLLQVSAVNVTAADNGDSYTFNIKF